jgi:hypothetical protein
MIRNDRNTLLEEGDAVLTALHRIAERFMRVISASVLESSRQFKKYNGVSAFKERSNA